MPIEIRELTIKISIEDDPTEKVRRGANMELPDMLDAMKDKIVEETIEQVMNQLRNNKDR